MSTPSQLGYRMPAEWVPHLGTWLTWPRREGVSFPDRYEMVPPVLAELVRHLAAVEEVHINVWNEDSEAEVREVLSKRGVPLGSVYFHSFPAYEPWCRDHGPIFLIRDRAGDRDRAIVDWDYNAWGNKYPPYDLDDAIPRLVAGFRQLPLFSPGIILEGGSIDVNGQGTVLTTEGCLLNPNRNPHLTRVEIEKQLGDYLGVSRVLWLGEGIAGDDTDGHIDDLARFVNETTVVTIVEKDPHDANYPILQDNLRRLKGMRDQADRPLRIVELPTPGVVEHRSQRLPASYANFYIANRVVLVPTFRHQNDAEAIRRLQQEFPDRQVIGLDSTELIWGLGSFHCLTQQEPA